MKTWKRGIAGVLLWSVLAMAFAPALSHAGAFGKVLPGDPSDVCSASRQLPGDSNGDRAPQNDHGTGTGHCPFCASHGAVTAPPRTTSGVEVPPGGHETVAASRSFTPRPSPYRALAQPRAPPPSAT